MPKPNNVLTNRVKHVFTARAADDAAGGAQAQQSERCGEPAGANKTFACRAHTKSTATRSGGQKRYI
jgi:hypothetical protein